MQKTITLDGKLVLETRTNIIGKLNHEIHELKVLFEQNQSSGDGRTFYDCFPVLGEIYGFL